MSQKNDEFFKRKKDWSQIKDEVLGCYIKPYFTKIFFAKSPIVYVDCFAGKGKFDDGNMGSPLIALNIIDEAIKASKTEVPQIHTYFIDLNYAEDLKNNLPIPNDKRNIHIIDGKFEDNIDEILSHSKNANVFLYIDPYGIKALNVNKLCSFIKNYSLKGIEVLINFNSFGFYRQACNVLDFKVSNTINGMNNFLIEYDSSNAGSEELTDIIGSSNWENIVIKSKNESTDDAFMAENELSKEFCKNLYKGFKYVLNMPIKSKDSNNPKYRMIYATNHTDGCLLMADNMYNRSLESIKHRLNGQLALWRCDINDKFVTNDEEKTNLLSMINDKWVECRELFCDYYKIYGVTTNISGLFNILKENEEKLCIKRDPNKSKKTGKPTSFWNFSKGNKIYVRKN